MEEEKFMLIAETLNHDMRCVIRVERYAADKGNLVKVKYQDDIYFGVVLYVIDEKFADDDTIAVINDAYDHAECIGIYCAKWEAEEE